MKTLNKPFLLGVDLGTSALKAVLFDASGEILASASADYPLQQPRNGWAEQEPEDWFSAAVRVIRQITETTGAAADIAAIAISGQMHGLVMTGEDGRVLHPAILWCDGRTGDACREIHERVGRENLIARTGNPALTGFTAGKILWMRENRPEVYRQCKAILLPKDYLRFRMTGKLLSEITDASGTNLLNIVSGQWDQEVLAALEIPAELLPPVCASTDAAGTVTPEFAALTGLKAGTPVMGGGGDNACAAVGTGVVAEGTVLSSLGTSGVLLAHSSTMRTHPQGRIHTFRSAVTGEYDLLSCTLAAGLSLRWFKDTFCREETRLAKEAGTSAYAYLDAMAEKVPAGANRLLYLPYLMGERSPILDENARGVFFGLSAMHTKADLLRAVLEGVVLSQRHCLDEMQALGVPAPQRITVCGGGATSALWRQITADMLHAEALTVRNPEGPALGAALIAGTGAGVYPSLAEACRQTVRQKEVTPPDAARFPIYDRAFELYRGLYPALKDSFAQLQALE